MAGYDYAGNNPTTDSDPTGRMLPGSGECGQPGASPCQTQLVDQPNDWLNTADNMISPTSPQTDASDPILPLPPAGPVRRTSDPNVAKRWDDQIAALAAANQRRIQQMRTESNSFPSSYDSPLTDLCHTLNQIAKTATNGAIDIANNVRQHWQTYLSLGTYGACLFITAGACAGLFVVVDSIELFAEYKSTGRFPVYDGILDLAELAFGLGAAKAVGGLWDSPIIRDTGNHWAAGAKEIYAGLTAQAVGYNAAVNAVELQTGLIGDQWHHQ